MNTKLKSALIGGCVFGTASSLPYLEMINTLCCALIIGAGVLASYLYFKDMEPTTGHLGQGAAVGWLAGVFGAVASTIVTVIVTAAGLKAEQAAQWTQMLEEQGVKLPEEFSGLLDMGTEVSASMIGMTLVFGLILYSIFSTIGGLVGAAMFAKKAEKTE